MYTNTVGSSFRGLNSDRQQTGNQESSDSFCERQLQQITGERACTNPTNQSLAQQGISVTPGVDPIAGTKMTIAIDGQEYTMSYSGFGLELDSLESTDGQPVSEDVVNLINENQREILKVGMNS